MSPESYALAKVWLAKARSDLATARLLITGSEPYLDTGSYHCQQAAEKAIKAWLAVAEVPIIKTHSLETLLHQCAASAPDYQQFLNHAVELTPLATEYRYPGDEFQPSGEEAAHALALAEELVEWIRAKFSALE